MSRLFITSRELNFISDIAKEMLKDVIGQVVYYYPISEIKTQTHGIYNESLQKMFDNPIQLDALVDNVFQTDTTINSFGADSRYKIEVFLHHRDLVEKGINISIGDFFSFSDVFYEITERATMGNIYGLPEHKNGIRIVGTKAREGQFNAPILGPTDISYSDENAVMKTFEQQRGRSENIDGATGDVRDLVKKGNIDQSLSGPHEISEKGAAEDDSHHGSSFYGDE